MKSFLVPNLDAPASNMSPVTLMQVPVGGQLRPLFCLESLATPAITAYSEFTHGYFPTLRARSALQWSTRINIVTKILTGLLQLHFVYVHPARQNHAMCDVNA